MNTLDQIIVAGLTLNLTPDGAGLLASPREQVTPELAALIRANKPALLAHLRATTWDGAEAEQLLERFVALGVAWAAIDAPAAASAWSQTADVVDQACAQQDMRLLRETVARYYALYAAWGDAAWPPVDSETARRHFAALGDPAAPGGQLAMGVGA